MLDLLPRLWLICLGGLLWIIDTGCDALANLFTWLLHNLIFRWMGGDDGSAPPPGG